MFHGFQHDPDLVKQHRTIPDANWWLVLASLAITMMVLE